MDLVDSAARWPLTDGELLTTHDVAALARVSSEAVRQWVRTGKLLATRTPNGTRIFLRAKVEEFLAAYAIRRRHSHGGAR